MSIIGAPAVGSFSAPTSQVENGGSATYTLDTRVNSAEELEVFVNNVQQEPTVAYSVASDGVSLTFTETTPSGTGTVYFIFRGLAQQHGTDTGAPRLNGNNTLTGNQTITGNQTVSGTIDTSSKASINLASSGNAIDFKLSDTTIGNIGVISDRVYLTAEGSHGVYLDASANNFCPSSTTGTDADGTIDLGASFAQWKKGYFADNIVMASNKGIDFANASAGTGGTGASETSTATVLDDYEEGTFTPSSNSVTGTNGGNGALVGFYVKVGNLVCCAVRFQADGMSTNGHQFGIYLPFLAHSTTGSGSYNAFTVVPVFYSANGNGQHRIGTLDGNSNYINMRQQSASSTSEITGNSMTGSFNMNLSIVYRTKD